MNKEFVPYEQALALKELGFDESCFGWFTDDHLRIGSVVENKHVQGENELLAPTFSQCFKWFRENYGLEGFAQRSEGFIWYKWKISQYNEDGLKYVAKWYKYETYEEAELACLIELIQIVKGGSNE